MQNTQQEIRVADSHVRYLEGVQAGSGFMMDSDELKAAKLRLARLQDAPGITGPLDLVEAVQSYLADSRSVEITINANHKATVKFTAEGAAQIERIFRKTISEQIAHALQQAAKRRVARRGTRIGEELI